MTKTALQKKIEHADAQKKVNPLDLSSDQDLTIALMNLIAIEENFPDSPIADMVHQIRVGLMRPIVDKASVKGDAWEILGKLLATVCACARIGDEALQNGDKVAAYRAYDDAYDAYVLFWGVVVFGPDATADK